MTLKERLDEEAKRIVPSEEELKEALNTLRDFTKTIDADLILNTENVEWESTEQEILVKWFKIETERFDLSFNRKDKTFAIEWLISPEPNPTEWSFYSCGFIDTSEFEEQYKRLYKNYNGNIPYQL